MALDDRLALKLSLPEPDALILPPPTNNDPPSPDPPMITNTAHVQQQSSSTLYLENFFFNFGDVQFSQLQRKRSPPSFLLGQVQHQQQQQQQRICLDFFANLVNDTNVPQFVQDQRPLPVHDDRGDHHHVRQQQPKQEQQTGHDLQQNQKQQKDVIDEKGEERELVDYSDRPRPYVWASNRPAIVLSLKELNSRGIHIISGTVACKSCDHRMEMGLNLKDEFEKLSSFIVRNNWRMSNCAPTEWIHPQLPSCPSCEKPNSMKPVIADNKRNINWLFMLLGKSLGCLSLKHLKYFCKHHKIHRTGSKDRVLYYTYLLLCKQLDPNPDGRFDIHFA